MAACSTRCRRSRRIVSGTSTRRTTAGSTSSSLIRRRATLAAVMPRGYGPLGWAASATEATRGDGTPDDRQCAWIDIVQFGGDDQRIYGSGAIATTVGTREQPCFSTQG